MIAGNERLIVVLGMAHSGTTILSVLLKQHPQVRSSVNGGEAWILENNWLPREDAAPIERMLRVFPDRRILLKRPWNCVWHGDWMAAEMPNARFLYCYRDFEEIANSWSKPTSFVDASLRYGGREHQREVYDFSWSKAEAFSGKVPFFKQVHHPEFVRDPAGMIDEIARWSELPPFDFDVSQVGYHKDVKRWLRQVIRSAGRGDMRSEGNTVRNAECGVRNEHEERGRNSALNSGDLLVRYAGRFVYRRLGYDQRPMELKPDGTIGEGAAGNERTWRVRMIGDDASHELVANAGTIADKNTTRSDRATLELELVGNAGVIAALRCDSDGVWRGRWNRFERMPVELIPAGVPIPEVRPVTHRALPIGSFTYITIQQLVDGAQRLARTLPPVRAVAGMPRSGMIPAATIALELNVPMIDLESLYAGRRPDDRELRRRDEVPREGIVLVVDDTAASGQQMRSVRERCPDVKTAAIYCDERAHDVVDYWHAPHPATFQAYEWNLFHDDNNSHLLTDFDGVLCDDWTGGDEDRNPDGYLNFLRNVKPRRIPTTSVWPLLAIVTGRLERHRAMTEDWLARHGIRYSKLVMSPHATARERDRAGDTAARKADEYRSCPTARLFVESCPQQATTIRDLTGRPVLCMERNGLV